MKRETTTIYLLATILFLWIFYPLNSQIIPETNSQKAFKAADRTLMFDINAVGVKKPIIWGLDLAWLSDDNIRRGIEFMGKENVSVIRSSFTPTAPLVDGELPQSEMNTLNERLSIIKSRFGNMNVILNCDHPSVDDWYKTNMAERWTQLIEVTARHHQNDGHTVVAVSPFNEPDYGWGQGTVSDFYDIAGVIKNNPFFNDIRISGGNTLNCDQALTWFNYLKTRIDEGNTHQLAGSFDSYATFYQTVRANGHHATNDELHNTMEAMVGVEYGLQTGIWWGTAELTRGEFCKASNGDRLAYAEHRPNWTAASVYRNTDGQILAFGGTSERQGVATIYRFVSKEKDMFFDGIGPQREYIMELPGGTGYQKGQTNAETMVRITNGDDIQPVIDGKYILVNRKSKKVMEINGSVSAGNNIQIKKYSGGTNQHWNVNPVAPTIGGDFSYHHLTSDNNNFAADVQDWSLLNGGNIMLWNNAKGGNQQWDLEYAEDGYFYIRSRHSGRYISLQGVSIADGTNVVQWAKKANDFGQHWRLVPVGAEVEFVAPNAPQNLSAVANKHSIRLSWDANSEEDLDGYTVFRKSEVDDTYQTIARNVKSTSFVDHQVEPNKNYKYAIRAIDKSLNRSDYSAEAEQSALGGNDLIAHYLFEEDINDNTKNLNNSASYGDIAYVSKDDGTSAVSLNGTNSFLQLPSTIANYDEITIATKVYWRGGGNWQRIFDFGNNEDEYMFLTPSNNANKMRFAIKNGGAEQEFITNKLATNKWVHIALTIGQNEVTLYIDGEVAVSSNSISIRPSDFKPIANYIGKSQYSDPLFKGYIDDFMIYNYELSQQDIIDIANKSYTSVKIIEKGNAQTSIWPNPANNKINIQISNFNSQTDFSVSLYSMNNVLLFSKNVKGENFVEVDTNGLNNGVYILKLEVEGKSSSHKIVVKH